MAQLVQKFIVEDASKASSILPQHVALVSPDDKPLDAPERRDGRLHALLPERHGR